MQDIHALRLSTHANMRWIASASYSFASEVIMLPIAIEELAACSVSLPLAFAHSDKATLVALTGLQPGKNVFVAPDGRWLGDYVPAVLRGYPFKLLPTSGGKWALAFDHGSGLLSNAIDAQPFFTAEGAPSDQVQKTFDFLLRVNSGLDRANSAVEALLSHDLLEQWPLKIRDGEREVAVEGLSRISETKLAALDDQAFSSLRAGGVLALAYAQLLSMANIDKLGKLARFQAQSSAKGAMTEDQLKSMFSADEAEDEIDWDAMLKDDKN